MTIEYKLSTIIRGSLIYAAGDTAAAIITDEWSWIRLLGILFVSATFYSVEIPNYFNWIDKKMSHSASLKDRLIKASLAMIYFNPLWIARHMLFIKLFMGQTDQIGWNILEAGAISFAINIPISLAVNYGIQNKVALEHRFIVSALFSGVMAVYYSLSAVWFG